MTSRTPRVKLVLKLQEGSTTVQEPDREVVKGIVHGYEVVEVDGFTYKRRRQQSPVAGIENTPPNATPVATPGPPIPGPPPPAPTPPPACPSLATQLAVRRYLKEHTSQLPEVAEPADRLAAVAASVGETVLDTCTDEAVTTALTSILQRFLLRIRTEAAAGRLGCQVWEARDDAAPPDHSAESFAPDLQARKAGLRARLTRYADVEAVGTLRALRAEVHAHMALQVEGLCMLTADVASLVESAGVQARAAQHEFHQERFRAFSHVDSPARLIQALTQPPLPLHRLEG
ncbi:hypothetical protein F751_5295 [Auxenochlorella protothecoides]|uniref:Uncharacterized protein n=1 Tax=Auxenochlorella protothecoides TaxID=3075 RepID=A0A087SRM8_AUXPR|nr:hypothetical protein F751_5295 [Auxenochlorella protothecoides]KFM28382.1 hypothetical protein F751_5295 [Auxenochlorella protothecoides]